MGIVLAMLIMIEIFRTRKSWIGRFISHQQLNDKGTLPSGSVTGWGWSHTGQQWHRFWSRCLHWSDGGAPSSLNLEHIYRFLAVPSWQGRQPDVWFCKALPGVNVLQHWPFHAQETQYSVWFFSGLGAWFVNAVLCLLYCRARKAFFGHFGHIPCEVHDGVFQLYTASLPCYCSRHVENLEDINSCF